jgi:hypothetical protein
MIKKTEERTLSPSHTQRRKPAGRERKKEEKESQTFWSDTKLGNAVKSKTGCQK